MVTPTPEQLYEVRFFFRASRLRILLIYSFIFLLVATNNNVDETRMETVSSKFLDSSSLPPPHRCDACRGCHRTYAGRSTRRVPSASPQSRPSRSRRSRRRRMPSRCVTCHVFPCVFCRSAFRDWTTRILSRQETATPPSLLPRRFSASDERNERTAAPLFVCCARFPSYSSPTRVCVGRTPLQPQACFQPVTALPR